MVDPDARPSEDGELSLVQQLLLEVLAEGGADPAAALETRCRTHPEFAGELRRRLSWLESTGLLRMSRSSDAHGVPERMGEFRIFERLGGGGMGVVYRARQESLDRDVALKLVRPEQLLFGEARERFRREVSSVARLNHPGIVPVYSIGEEDGVPFFAMELVRGATLADLLRPLAARASSTLSGRDLARALAEREIGGEEGEPAPLFAGSWEDTVLRIVREVAEALEHAHRAELVHRDVKPSNVMVTRGGRVMLLDFGLSSDLRADAVTRTGSQVGSLPYMSPEQLSGKRADRRSDVYSLGVTMYELLALRLPYAESHAPALAQRVMEGRPPRIRRRDANVSWEAETVCLKAIELDPEHRYPSAGDFARDLTNVLERRPISARRAGWPRRAQRFCQRSPGAAAALVLACLLFGVAPAAWAIRERATSRRLEAQGREIRAANVSLEGANAALEASLAETRREQARAETNFQDALAAVDRMLTRLADERLEHVPHVELLRRELYGDALEFYEELAERREGDAGVAHELARARLRMSSMQTLLGRDEHGDASMLEGIALLERCIAESPDDVELRRELAHALSEASTAYGNMDRVAEQQRSAERAVETLRALLASDPERFELRYDLAVALRALARARRMAGRPAETDEPLREASALLAGAAAESTDEAALLYFELVRDLARALVESSRGDEAEALLLPALELAERRSAEAAENPRLLHAVADLLHPLARVAMARGEREEAAALWARETEIAEELARDFPGYHVYQDDLLRAHVNHGLALQSLERFSEAAEHFQRAIEVGERIVAALPDVPQHNYQLAVARLDLADALLRQSQAAPALALLEAAVPALEQYAAAKPDDRDASRSTIAARTARAECRIALGRHEPAALDLRHVRTLAAEAGMRFNATILFARCAALAAAEEALDAEQRATRARAYEDEALDALRWAVDGGFRDRAWLESVDAFAPLRARPEFEQIVAELR